MRILLTADPELPVPPRLYGGIERIVDALAREYTRRGHSVGLVAHPESECPAERLFPWPGSASQNRSDAVRNSAALWRAVREFRPDVLHSFSRLAYMLPLMPSPLPKIMSYQRSPGPANARRALKLARGGSLSFTGCSAHICGLGREGGGDWHAIPNFVHVESCSFAAEVPEDAPLVFLSRIERIKGAHRAIAIARAANRRLIIAGNRIEQGEGARYWCEEIEPHIDGTQIEYVGPVDDAAKDDLLQRAAALLVPIEWDEPFGIVFAEALARGTPVISSPRGALPEIVENGRHGFLIRTDAEGVEAVRRLGEIDRAACRARAQQLFDLPVVAQQYLGVYEAQLAATRNAGVA